MKGTPLERFTAKFVIGESGCWLWTASLTIKGYGTFWDGERLVPAHRWSYEHHVGPIPVGLVLDHTCRVRCCVCPTHLEAVTTAENIRRGKGVAATFGARTHCQNGHALEGDNLYIRSGGGRRCRTCQRDYTTEWSANRKAVSE